MSTIVVYGAQMSGGGAMSGEEQYLTFTQYQLLLQLVWPRGH